MSIAQRDSLLERHLGERSKPDALRRSHGRTHHSRRGWLVRRALLVADILGLTLAFLGAELLVGPGRHSGWLGAPGEIAFFVATLPGWIVAAKLYGLYDRDDDRADHTTADDLGGVLHLLTVGTWLLFATVSLTGLGEPQIRKFVAFWGFALVMVTLMRCSARGICRRRGAYQQNTLIVGAGEVGQQVAERLSKHPEYGLNLIGFVDSAPLPSESGGQEQAVIGGLDELTRIVLESNVERVIFAFSSDPHEETLRLIRALNDFDVRVDIVPRLFELLPATADIHSIEGMSLIGLPRGRLSRSSRFLKRAMDASISALGLALLAPVFLVIALLVKLGSRGPVFFRQVRMGAEGTFLIYKFRTMENGADERKGEVAHLNKHARTGGDPRMFKIPNDPRVTPFGRFLRRYSLDELPQLINVLKGEMTLVGPRPLILDEDRHVDDWARRRLDLKPGITGLWQVLGRDSIGFEEMVRLDYLYVTTWSLWGDLWLLIRTLPILAAGERPPPVPGSLRS